MQIFAAAAVAWCLAAPAMAQDHNRARVHDDLNHEQEFSVEEQEQPRDVQQHRHNSIPQWTGVRSVTVRTPASILTSEK